MARVNVNAILSKSDALADVIKNAFLDSFFTFLVLGVGFCLLTGCGHKPEGSLPDSPQTNLSGTPIRDERQWTTGDYQRDKEAALRYAAKVREETLRNPPAKEEILPNFDSGPGFPRPLGVNFYQIDDRYPAYLLCTYDVNENSYESAKEPEWFKAAILQIRASGHQRFPPHKWVAISIFNRSDDKGAGNFEQRFKVGAVFNAIDVFDSSTNPLKLIARAEKDPLPFKDNPKGAQQQRWVIVERHAATNRASIGPTQGTIH